MERYGIFRFAALACPKAVEHVSQDAYAYYGNGLPWAQLAIADGSSKSCWGGQWARALVGIATDKAYSAHTTIDMGTPQNEALQKWIARARINHQPQPPPATDRMRRLAREGDYSTILYSRLEMRHPGSLTVVTSVIGDTCIFILTPDELRYSFPIRRVCSFGDPHDLLWSKHGQEDNEPCLFGATRVDGPFVVMACTQLLASWFLCCHENGKRHAFISYITKILRGERQLSDIGRIVPKEKCGSMALGNDLTVVLAASHDGERVKTRSPFFALRQAILDAETKSGRDENVISATFPP